MSAEVISEEAINNANFVKNERIGRYGKKGQLERTIELDRRVKELRNRNSKISNKDISKELQVPYTQISNSVQRLKEKKEIKLYKQAARNTERKKPTIVEKHIKEKDFKSTLIDFLSINGDEPVNINDLKFHLEDSKKFPFLRKKYIEKALNTLKIEGFVINIESDEDKRKKCIEKERKVYEILDKVEEMLLQNIFSASEIRRRLNFANDGVIPIANAIERVMNRLQEKLNDEPKTSYRDRGDVARDEAVIMDLLHWQTPREDILEHLHMSPLRFTHTLYRLIKTDKIRPEATVYLYTPFRPDAS